MVAAPQMLPASRQILADALLNRRVVRFLADRQVPDATELEVESHFGTVVVSGKVESRHDRWLCLECCRRVAGVIKLVDQLEIASAGPAKRVA